MLKSNIQYWIDKRGYKNKWVAKQMNVSNEVFSRWVNNHTKPSLENTFRLARILECNVDDLYYWSDEDK